MPGIHTASRRTAYANRTVSSTRDRDAKRVEL